MGLLVLKTESQNLHQNLFFLFLFGGVLKRAFQTCSLAVLHGGEGGEKGIKSEIDLSNNTLQNNNIDRLEMFARKCRGGLVQSLTLTLELRN